MAKKDIVSKNLIGYNDVFADIVNGFLFDGRMVVKDESLTPADKGSHYKADGKIRSQERDVSKFWMNANIKIAFVGIENQSIPDEYMPLRVISYDGAEYRNQYTSLKGRKNQKGYPVVTLVLYYGSKEWTYGNNLHSCLDIPKELLPFVNDYKINLYSVKDMTPEQINAFKSDFKVIAEYIHALANKVDYHPSDKKLDHPEEVIDMISVFSGDDRFREEYNFIINNNQGGVTMCEIYDKIEQKGYNKGVAEGRAEGEAKGFLKALVGLVKKGLLTDKQAAEQANMTVEEFEKQYAIYS